MPAGVVRTAHQEHMWEQAKEAAARQGHEGEWAYVNGTFQRLRARVGGAKGRDAYRRRMKRGAQGRLVLRKAEAERSPAEQAELARRGARVPSGGVAGQRVYGYLRRTYPASVLGWVVGQDWHFWPRVPLARIRMERRPGGRDLEKVAAIEQALRQGKPMEPVVLVGSSAGLLVADGYHRTLAYRHAGRKTIAAYVAIGARGFDLRRMHGAKLNKALLLKAADDRWITIGGHPEGSAKHRDGTPVLLDKQGRIVGGRLPRRMWGRKVQAVGRPEAFEHGEAHRNAVESALAAFPRQHRNRSRNAVRRAVRHRLDSILAMAGAHDQGHTIRHFEMVSRTKGKSLQLANGGAAQRVGTARVAKGDEDLIEGQRADRWTVYRCRPDGSQGEYVVLGRKAGNHAEYLVQPPAGLPYWHHSEYDEPADQASGRSHAAFHSLRDELSMVDESGALDAARDAALLLGDRRATARRVLSAAKLAAEAFAGRRRQERSGPVAEIRDDLGRIGVRHVAVEPGTDEADLERLAKEARWAAQAVERLVDTDKLPPIALRMGTIPEEERRSANTKNPAAWFSPGERAVVLGPRSDAAIMTHEYAHALDHALHGSMGIESWLKQGEWHYPEGSPLHGLVGYLKTTEAHKRFAATPRYRAEPGYFSQDGEIFARWFPQWVASELGRRGHSAPSDFGRHDEDYDAGEMRQASRLFAAALGRFGLSKAILLLKAGSERDLFGTAKRQKPEARSLFGREEPPTYEGRARKRASRPGAPGERSLLGDEALEEPERVELEERYPGGVWRTVRGHHVFVHRGHIVPETLPPWMREEAYQEEMESARRPPGQHRPPARLAKAQGDHWVTIGGHEEGEEQHKDGHPVLLDCEGRIIGGSVPRAFHGKTPAELRDRKALQREWRDVQGEIKAVRARLEAMDASVPRLARELARHADAGRRTLLEQIREVTEGAMITPDATEENREIPSYYKRRGRGGARGAWTLDAVADAMGMTENQVRHAIHEAEARRANANPREFEDEAEAMIHGDEGYRLQRDYLRTLEESLGAWRGPGKKRRPKKKQAVQERREESYRRSGVYPANHRPARAETPSLKERDAFYRRQQEEAARKSLLLTSDGLILKAQSAQAAALHPHHEAVRAALRHVAGMDSDRARERNGVGFSKYDNEHGHALANAEGHYSDRELAHARSLVNKYRRQIPAEMHERIKATEGAKPKEPLPAGAHWITTPSKAAAPGAESRRHILIDGEGRILGGSIPKAAQGRHITDWWKERKEPEPRLHQHLRAQGTAFTHHEDRSVTTGHGYQQTRGKFGPEAAPGHVRVWNGKGDVDAPKGYFTLDSAFADKDRVKSLGGRWGPSIGAGKAWFLPVDRLPRLLKEFPHAEVSAKAHQRYENWAEEHAPAKEAARPTTPTEKPQEAAPPAESFAMPEGMNREAMAHGDLHNYQKNAVRFLLDSKRAILGHAVGLGKTLTAITAAKVAQQKENAGPFLVLCPSSRKYGWADEIEKFAPGTKAVVLDASLSPKRQAERWAEAEGRPDFIITNYETLQKPELAEKLHGLAPNVIADEAHRVKNRKAKTTAGFGAWKGARYAWLLTATPMPNGQPEETYTMLSHVVPGIGSWTAFARDHAVMETVKTPFGSVQKPVRLKNVDALRQKMQRAVQIKSMTDPDVGLQLPDRRRVDVSLDMGKDQQKMYDALRAEIAAEVEGMSPDAFSQAASNVMVKLKRLEQIAIDPDMIREPGERTGDLSPKESWAAETIADHLEDPQNRGVVLFCDARLPLDKLRGALRKQGLPVAMVTGSQSPAERQQTERDFTTGKVKVVLATSAAEEGMNLQHGGHTLIHLDAPWVPKSVTQREGRVHRQGQPSPFTTHYHVTARGTVEQTKQGTLGRKARDIDALLGTHGAEDMAVGRSLSRAEVLRMLRGEKEPSEAEPAKKALLLTSDGLLRKGFLTDSYGDPPHFRGFGETTRPHQRSRRADDEVAVNESVFAKGRGMPHYHGADHRLYRCAHRDGGRMVLQEGDRYPTWVSERQKRHRTRLMLHDAETPYWEKAWSETNLRAPTPNSAWVAVKQAGKHPDARIMIDAEGRIRLSGPGAAKTRERIRGKLERMQASDAWVGGHQSMGQDAGFRPA